ncbi:MAG TPA: DNA replication/repair protein RecF [Hyphomicrobiaceae bacterium]|nr:DNA replication/repair protein RecF [Hyphomicrobiaceae bacterium]
MWIERIQLTDFRNYAAHVVKAGPAPVVLCGANGAGKTNLLEAISLLSPGQGLRRAPLPELARAGQGTWAVAARLHTPAGIYNVGTGLAEAAPGARARRVVRINGQTQAGTGALGDYAEMLWLTPAMDGLFTGPAADRRRFLDRLVQCFDPGYRAQLGQFERAMQQRNRLLADNVGDELRYEGFEQVMGEAGVAIAASRRMVVAELQAAIASRRASQAGAAFPWADVALEGALEAELATRPAIDVEDHYIRRLAQERDRDRAAGRTLAGPHRSDLMVGHGPKGMPARVCSTGEQKALLIGLVLAHADLVRHRHGGVAPILLLDEIGAHLDQARRRALFDEIVRLGTQAWMTGTDFEAFSALGDKAQFFALQEGRVDLRP